MISNQAAVAKKESKHLVVFIASVAALAGILFGFDTGVISGAILFISKEFQLTPLSNGLVVSSVLLGALLGSSISGRVADRYGRRHLLIITALIFIIGTIASAMASDMVMLVCARIIVGIAIGISSFVAPLYISEIAPIKHRGALVSLNQLAITCGIVLSYIVDYIFADSGAWRWMLGLGVLPAIALLIGMMYLPYSPRWLALRGFSDRARLILQRIRGTEDVEVELAEIHRSLAQEKANWRSLFQRWMRPALIVGLGLALFQQVTGINTIIYYAPTIFMIAGFKGAAAQILATMGVGVVNVVFTIISLPLIDKWGRRPLLLIGLTGMIISLAILSYTFHSATPEKWLALASMILYIACFAISLGPIMWLVISEIFPLTIRGFASSLSIAASWGFNMIVALTFLSLVKTLGPGGTFLLYCIISILGWLFVYFMVPETKGISLEHIEVNLRAGKKSRELGAAT